MNDSRELQDVESAGSGRLSHVPSQPAIVPSPCGMLSRDQSLRLDTWNLLGTSGIVCDSPLAPIDSSSTPHRGMFHSWNLNAADGNPGPRFARRPSTMKSFFPAEGVYPPELRDQQRLQISDLQFDIPTPSTFSCSKIRFKTPVSACSGSPSEAMLWIKEVEMSDSVDDFLIIALNSRSYSISRNLRCWMLRIASALNMIIQNSCIKKKVSRGTACSERRSVPSRKTDRLHDLQLLQGYWRS